MRELWTLTIFQMKRRVRDGFSIGYNVIFPLVITALLGLLTKKQFTQTITSYQYYALVMIPFCATMSIITAAYAGKEDAYAKTASRYLIAPIHEKNIVVAKILSCSLIFSCCNGVTFFVCCALWHIPSSENWWLIFLLLCVLSFVIASIGVLIGTGMKNFLVLKNVINIPIGLCAVAAGVFYPFGTSDRLIQSLQNLSPLTWINRFVFAALYDCRSKEIGILIVILVMVGVGMTALAVKNFQKEEFIHGDLPGYQK
ncbi:ABC transporter permease [Anaerosporobacter faecicola]|uniref:ABC transporter permease n=1 Tax=Anaerosporobacter faecicola TaxID=2718714 RepID=UPI0014396274|nr:ABC transporter permease [Anaerosporobacter faecicola]